jgi:hypothetical protein
LLMLIFAVFLYLQPDNGPHSFVVWMLYGRDRENAQIRGQDA